MDRYILTPKARRRREIVADIELCMSALAGAIGYAIIEALIRAVMAA